MQGSAAKRHRPAEDGRSSSLRPLELVKVRLADIIGFTWLLASSITAVVVEHGAVYVCGRGVNGQLGLNSYQHQLLPARVGVGRSLLGYDHRNARSSPSLHPPRRIRRPLAEDARGSRCASAASRVLEACAEVHGDAPVLMVAAGGFHRATLTEDGAIQTCGAGSYGQLGHGDAEERLLPTRLGQEEFGGLPVVFVACGYHDGVDGRGMRLDVRQQRLRPAWPRRQDTQAPAYAG